MKTQFLEIEGAKLAYRTSGNGQPLILCNRFRGTLDTWDPLFINELARTFNVITFDYPGIGYSEGSFPSDIKGLALVLKNLAEHLKIETAVLGGWSFGGYVAQIAALTYEDLATHMILIGSNPPGKNELTFEPIFLERALKPVNTIEDEDILFFEPASPNSVKTSRASHERIYREIDISKIPSSQEVFNLYFVAGSHYTADVDGFRQKFAETDLPVMILHGDHDVSFPIENWFAFLRKLKNGQLIIYTSAGHGPQHQLPELSAAYIREFVMKTKALA